MVRFFRTDDSTTNVFVYCNVVQDDCEITVFFDLTGKRRWEIAPAMLFELSNWRRLVEISEQEAWELTDGFTPYLLLRREGFCVAAWQELPSVNPVDYEDKTTDPSELDYYLTVDSEVNRYLFCRLTDGEDETVVAFNLIAGTEWEFSPGAFAVTRSMRKLKPISMEEAFALTNGVTPYSELSKYGYYVK